MGGQRIPLGVACNMQFYTSFAAYVWWQWQLGIAPDGIMLMASSVVSRTSNVWSACSTAAQRATPCMLLCVACDMHSHALVRGGSGSFGWLCI